MLLDGARGFRLSASAGSGKVSLRKPSESRREERMSEHNYRKFLPGDEVKLKIEIRYPRMNLRAAGVVFRHEERDKSELSASGPTEGEGDSRVAELTLEVPPGAVTGVYRANPLWVETYERVYRYEEEEVAAIANRIAFEVLDEPDEKPDITLSYR